MQITVNDRSFDYNNEFSLLDALEGQEIEANYSCRGGFCGVCRARLIEGEVQYIQEPLVPINNGELLSCCCIPKTDIRIDLL